MEAMTHIQQQQMQKVNQRLHQLKSAIHVKPVTQGLEDAIASSDREVAEEEAMGIVECPRGMPRLSTALVLTANKDFRVADEAKRAAEAPGIVKAVRAGKMKTNAELTGAVKRTSETTTGGEVEW
ncbi:hypothetical protein NDU88_008241 [Pleurodeles waltl]|uniref:Uncharacterized protein n=1 Tax=Pleurodeles waltl TaxID=8319 RepID=A0AAV7QU60_PLEWA|nr:hypothetical protein NDU88_008241 [Pleurodeles waltl]